MSPAMQAADLMRSLGLDVDGPTRWGARPTTSKPGVFVVETVGPTEACQLDIDAVRRWLERVPDLRLDGERPTQSTLAARLREFWIAEQPVLYVGRSSKSLGARVAALYATELGHARPHPGGHWLKTLRDPSSLRVWWAETDAAEEYEDELIEAFAGGVDDAARAHLPADAPVLPWANLGSPSGRARETGISGALRMVDVAPAGSSVVRRSDSRARKRPTSPAATRSPRRTATRSAAGNAAAAAGQVKPKAPVTHVTPEGLAALEAELQRLRDVERPQVVERVKHARELGDLRENADYEAARNEQAFLEGRIQQLEQQLRTAVVIETRSGGGVGMGSRLVCEIDGQRVELAIVGSAESDPDRGRISAASPVGKALLGHGAGDEVEVVTPAARIHYRIVEVT